MEYQIAIYSTDTVFARMLELEFSMRGFTVLTADDPSDGHYSDVVLLDLDSSVVPSPDGAAVPWSGDSVDCAGPAEDSVPSPVLQETARARRVRSARRSAMMRTVFDFIGFM